MGPEDYHNVNVPATAVGILMGTSGQDPYGDCAPDAYRKDETTRRNE